MGIIPIQTTIATFIPPLIGLQVTELWHLSEKRNYIPGEWGGWRRSENRTHTHLASPPPRDIEVSVLSVLGLAIPATCLDVHSGMILCKVWSPRTPKAPLSLTTAILERPGHCTRSHTGYLIVKGCQGPSHIDALHTQAQKMLRNRLWKRADV